MMRIKTIWIAGSTVLAAAMLSAGDIAPTAADTLAALDTEAVIDGSTAAGLCFTSYPDVTAGLDELSPCQWDMEVINALAAHTTATGLGVKVGVIDGGVDFDHPDLAGLRHDADRRPTGSRRRRLHQ